MTRLGTFCDRLLEAGWLAAIGTVPMYFDIFSNRAFEPDKITVLRCIVTVMALAQLVKWEECAHDGKHERNANVAGAVHRGDVWHIANSLGLPALAVTATWLIGTALSITPAVSFWGSYQRLQGTYSMLTYVVMFFLIAVNLRRRAQLERLFTLVLIVSLPISLYGVAQYLHLDPLTWGSDTTMRVTSSMGNAIFLAAYLIMVVPITLLRLMVSVQRLRGYGKVAGAELFQGARRVITLAGVLIAEMLGLSIFALATPGSPSTWWAALPMIGALVALAMLFTIPRPTFFTTLAEAAGYFLLLALQLTTLFLTGSRGPWIGMLIGMVFFVIALAVRRGRCRLLAVASGIAVATVAFLVIFNLPNSPLAPLRAAPYLGRLGVLSDTRIDTVRVRILIWQGTWDLLTRRPPIGLAGNDPLGPARLLFGYGPESMYVAFNKVYPPELAHYEARNASPDRNHNDLLDNVVNVGILGLAAYGFLLVMAFRLIWRQLRRVPHLTAQAALVAILAALLAHVVESLSGIVIAASREYLWVYLGILASGVLWHDERQEMASSAPQTSTAAGTDPGQITVWPVVAFGLLALIGIGTLRFVPQVEDAQIGVITSFGGLIVGLVAASLALGGGPAGRFCRTSRIPVYVLSVLAAVAIVVANFNVVAADIYFKRGLLSERAGQFGDGVAQYHEALRLAGNQDYYYLHLGSTYLELAKMSKRSNGVGSEQMFEASGRALEQALRLNPLNTDHYVNLGRLYRVWGDPDDRAKLDQADNYYRQATTLRPRAAHLYDEWGQLDVARGDLEAAVDKVQQAAAIDPEFDATFVLLGDVFLLEGHPFQALEAHGRALAINPAALSDWQFEQRIASYEHSGALPQVADAYAQALQRSPDSPATLVPYGYTLLRQNKLAEARFQLEASIRSVPNDWIAHRYLALVYQGLGMTDEALANARAALREAPANQAAGLQTFLGALEKD